MPSFYTTSRNALFQLRRDLWGLLQEKPTTAVIPAIATSSPAVKRHRRDNDASGVARRAKEMMERHHLI
ncbi:hypothetical protein CYK37_26575 [Mesorhizobium loti]|nr:hypothetical protein [Mesorhizobium loti]PLP56339.1 hypothetical protein CYK37_26575 [Mesorhizobium loti]